MKILSKFNKFMLKQIILNKKLTYVLNIYHFFLSIKQQNKVFAVSLTFL